MPLREDMPGAKAISSTGCGVLLALAALAASGCAGRRGPALPVLPDGERGDPALVEATGTGERIRLAFAWPERLEGACVVGMRRQRPGRPTEEGTLRYRLEAATTGDEIVVSSLDIETVSAGMHNAPQRDARPLRDVVGRDGGYRRLDGLEEMVAAMPQPEGLADEQRRQMLQAATAAISARSAEDWNASVGAWVGAEFTVGELYARTVEEPVAAGKPLTIESQVRAEGRVPCMPDATERRCVRLRARTRPVGPGTATVLGGFIGELVPPDQADRVRRDGVRDALAESEALVVVEPDTLVPYQVERRRVMQLTLDGPDGARTLQGADVVIRRCTYTGRP